MPTRFIKESCRSSKNLHACSDFTERLFWRLLTTADDFGRFLACPCIVKSTCFPRDEKMRSDKVSQAMLELEKNQLIVLYSVGDREYGEFVTFSTHQGKPRAKESKYPDKSMASSVLQASASNCMQPLAYVTGHPDTDTDTNLNSLNSPDPDEEGVQGEKQEFDQFWQAYPRKVGRKAAQKAFQNAQDRPRIDDLVEAIHRARDSSQWLKDGGQFIPHPSTWLNRGGWADEPVKIESAFKRSMNSFLERHKEEE